MAKILLLEDDPILSYSLLDYLELEGFEVELVCRGSEASECTYKNHYDLYLFDVNVPDIDGFTLLEMLRNTNDTTPTIFLTALSDIGSMSKGFDVGADDYIKKPFDADELLVRIRSKIKASKQIIIYGQITFNPATKTIHKNQKVIDLGEVATAIFGLLMSQKNQTILKTDFYDVMESPSDQALRVHINRLKKALEIEIINVRSIGYRLENV